MAGIDLSTLNDDQRRIACTLDSPLFVEAGAGSGKTFTLTQRIAWALSPGSGADGGAYLDDLSQVLVITFTNAAAREIKERVRATLRAAGMREQALQVDSSWISTIHGMCSRILRRHALDLGLDPAFRVASGNQERELRNQALMEVVGAASRDRQDPALAAAFSSYDFGKVDPVRGNTGVVGLVDRIMQAQATAPGGPDSLWVPPAADMGSAMGELLVSYGSLEGQRLSAKAADVVREGLAALTEFDALAPGQKTPEAALAALDRVRLPRSSKALAEVLPQAKADLALARAEAQLAGARPAAEALVRMASQATARYGELKHEQSLLDNDDLIGLALDAVCDVPQVAADYVGRFRLVMVDEFQDTDARQLRLIQTLSGEGARHLTTVGDAQQSIYRFRGADVGVFRGRGRSLPEGSQVRMSTNYRSHTDVLALVDRVCGRVMDGFMHLDGSPTRRDRYRAHDLPRVDVELAWGTGRAGEQQVAVEAYAIAERLRAYADAGQEPGGMALLLRSTTHADLYIDAIRAQGLDCVVTGGSTFTQTPEVATMQALLHYLANEHDTQSGLFAVLTSPLFGLDADDLVRLGTGSQQRCDAPAKRPIERGLATMGFRDEDAPSARLRRAHEVLVQARSLMRRVGVADVCLYVVRASGWLSRLEEAGPDGLAVEANVLAAVDYIRDLTKDLGLGPARAAEEFDTWLAVSKVPPASLAGGASSAVRVMTVHASKGLQFPVVAVAECWADPRADGMASGPACDEGGAARTAVVVPPKGFSYAPDEDELAERPRTLGEWYARLRADGRAADAAEATRLLYVALTRAEEAVIVGISGYSTKTSGCRPELAEGVVDALWEGELPPTGDSTLDYGGSEPAHVRRVDVVTQVLEDGTKGRAADSAGALPALDGPLPDAASIVRLGTSRGAQGSGDGRFSLYEVQDVELARHVRMARSREGVFSYTSMSRLQQAAAADAQGAPSPAPDVPTRAERDAEQEGAPAAQDADRATNLGSAFHELAQTMVETGRQPTDEQVARMERTWRLGPRAAVRLERALERWWGSSLRTEALSHARLRAEVPFFSPADSSYGRYVEGAIDLLASDPGSDAALLVDYKTGDLGLGRDEVRARHAAQASLYAWVLLHQGFRSVACHFVCVELADPDAPDEPLVVTYRFDADNPPRLP